MIVPFDSIPDSARVWIFQSSALLDAETSAALQYSAEQFLNEWTAHNMALKAGFCIVDRIFFVVAVDESQTGASGCSIDKLHRFVKEAEISLGLNLLDRLRVAIPGIEPRLIPLAQITEQLNDGVLHPKTEVYDVTVDSLGAFRERFKTPLSNTWLSRYLQNT